MRPRNGVGSNHTSGNHGLALQSSSANTKARAENVSPALAWYRQRPASFEANRVDGIQTQPAVSRGGVAGPLHVFAPPQEAEARSSSSSSDSSFSPSEESGLPLLSLSTPTSGRELVPTVSSEEILQPVREDMEIMANNLKSVVGKRHPLLMAAAQQIFGAGGKKLRPAIVLLVARATAELAGMR